MPPCICTLTRSVPALERILAILQQGPLDATVPAGPTPPDLAALAARLRESVKNGELSGGMWRSGPVWRKKVAAILQVYLEEFVTEAQAAWHANEPWMRGGRYDALAKSVGGIEIWDRALRLCMEADERHTDANSSEPDSSGIRTRVATYALSGWHEFVGQGAYATKILDMAAKEGRDRACAEGFEIVRSVPLLAG